ncbi:hypothetical protein [Methylomagnum sp.]
MKTSNLILKSAIVATLGLASMGAIAGTASFGSVATYAIEGIPSTGSVTIPAGVTYTTAAGAAESGLLTITLPSGVTFVSTPTVSGDGVNVANPPVVGGGGAGSNFITINYTRLTGAAGGTIALGAFQITGATTLASVTGATGFLFSAQASGFATAANNDASPTTASLAQSGRQLIITPTPNFLTINVPAPSNATRWLAGGNTIATSGSVGTLVVNNGIFRNAANTAAFAFTSATASATLTGNFTGVTSAYLAPAAGACATTAPAGATTGTVTSSTVTFTGITPSGTVRQVCLGVTGTTILQETLSGVAASAQQDTFTTTATNNLGTIAYNGGVNQLNYVVGSGDGFASYLRVVNRDSVAAPVRVVVQNDTGAVTSGLLDTIPANTGKLYTTAQINTATGSALNGANDRAALVILTPTANVASDNLLANPNGTVLSLP